MALASFAFGQPLVPGVILLAGGVLYAVSREELIGLGDVAAVAFVLGLFPIYPALAIVGVAAAGALAWILLTREKHAPYVGLLALTAAAAALLL
jgi:hypothetical protein